MGVTWAERLRQQREARFVGRARELERLRALATVGEPAVAFVHGPGGVGKTTLLDRLLDSVAADVRTIRLDARDVAPWPEALAQSLAAATGASTGEDPIAEAAARGPLLLVIDTFELIAALEPWLRARFLPGLPAGVAVVLAGRDPPSAAWRADPAWRDVLVPIELPNLEADEARALLERRGLVGTERQDAVVRATHGHPLALALLADVAAQRGDGVPTLGPDAVGELLRRLVRDVPDDRHRQALEVAAVLRTVDEAALRAHVGGDAAELFRWLSGLSFMRRRRDGLAPHDLARDVLLADLAARDPERRRALEAGARERLVAQLATTAPTARAARMLDLFFLLRTSPAVAGFYTFRDGGAGAGEPARPDDREAILALVAEHEGAASAAIASAWLEAQPASFTVFRAGGAVVAVLGAVWVASAAEVPTRDPALDAAFAYVATRGGLARGDRLLYLRFWIARGADQEVSPIQDVVQARVTSAWLTTPDLGWSFVATRRPDVWSAQFASIGMPAADDAGFDLGGRRYVVYPHDWRRTPPHVWLTAPPPEQESRAPTHATARPDRAARLDRDAFAAAVRAALRDFVRDAALERSPLLGARIVVAAAAPAAPGIAEVRRVIEAAAHALDAHPRDRRLLRALDATYLRPAATQERAAERLGVPFGTYRRQLAQATERVVALLWEREERGDARALLAALDDG